MVKLGLGSTKNYENLLAQGISVHTNKQNSDNGENTYIRFIKK